MATHLRRTKAAIKVQKVIRAWLCRKKYSRIQAATQVLQRFYRGHLARKYTQALRKNNAVCYLVLFIDNILCIRNWPLSRISIGGSIFIGVLNC